MVDIETQQRWDERYRDSQAPLPAVRVLAENAHLLPRTGAALDLACGLGGNALLLARRGLTTFAWDISAVAVEKVRALAQAEKLPLIAEVRDALEHPLEPERFDVVVCTHFLERRLTLGLVQALKPGGLLFYQTFTRMRASDEGPGKDEWRLADGELLTMFPPLLPVVYREERLLGDITQGLRSEALLVAKKNDTE